MIKRTRLSILWLATLIAAFALAGCDDSSDTASVNTPADSTDETTGNAVNVATNDTATLSWVAPLARTDGESLTMGELQGYIIRYGQSPSSLNSHVAISAASDMKYTINSLGAGSWYFTVQVVDVNGLVSPPSSIVSKTI